MRNNKVTDNLSKLKLKVVSEVQSFRRDVEKKNISTCQKLVATNEGPLVIWKTRVLIGVARANCPMLPLILGKLSMITIFTDHNNSTRYNSQIVI